MFKFLPIIPSSTFQKITHYSYFILRSLATYYSHIIFYALLFKVLYPEKHELVTYYVVAIV